MATFGFTTDGPTSFSPTADALLAYRATAPENGTITSIWVRTRRATSNSCPFRTGLYDNSASPVLLNNTGAEVTVTTVTPTWHESVLGTPYDMTSGEQLNIAVFCDINTGGSSQLTFYRDAIDVDALSKTTGNTYPTWPDPAGTGTTTQSYSIYAQYTPTSGTTHGTTGDLVGPGAVVAGSATRIGNHDATGAVVGPGAVVAGSAARIGVTPHPSTGVLVGPGSVVAGTAVRNATHTATGALVGAGAILGGVATRFRVHTSSGALTGQGSAVLGAAAVGDVVDLPSSVLVLGWMSDYNMLSGSMDGDDTFVDGEI
jgi:hypothetical protein